MNVKSDIIAGKKIAIYTLGCKVNQYESDSMMEVLSKAGALIVEFAEGADVYIINTCSVTNMAERKSRQIIHRAKKKNENAVIVACGCYVQAEKEKLENDLSIDIIVGNNRKNEIVRILEEYYEDKGINDNFIDINKSNEYEYMYLEMPTEHCRAYVKVQDGCNNFCTYCIIPYTRGRIRSRNPKDVVEEVIRLAKRGIKEVVITGINLSSYEYEGNDLLKLLNLVSEIDGIERIRMGSLEPRIITDEFLEAISKNEKICPHFHLSLQSACNDTLKRMNRKYTIEEYMERCELIRKYYEMPALTTDVIVGFPGETEEEFEATVKNLEALNLYEMHIFKYSKRNGTIAAQMPNQVRDEIKEARSNILLEMTKRNKEQYEKYFKGKKEKVLVEEFVEKEGKTVFKGHTTRYILVEKVAPKSLCEDYVNKIIEVEL